MTRDVVVYVKEDCHLCDNLMAAMGEAISGLPDAGKPDVTVRDIEARDDWYERYREYVPVVIVDGDEVCHYFFEAEEFLGAIADRPRKTS